MADRVERAFFNAAPAVVSRDFKSHVYHQTPNRIAPNLPGGGAYNYRTTQGPLCCMAALNRFLPNYVLHLWMATYENGLAATHYGPCKVAALVADRVPVELECQTDYPFNDFIDVTVKPAPGEAATEDIRSVPYGCAKFRVSMFPITAGAFKVLQSEKTGQPKSRQ